VADTTLQTFLFTDLVGSTELKNARGDAEGSAAIAEHDALFRRCLGEFGGEERSNPGDGFFATFAVPSDAVRCALAFQRGLAEDTPLRARVGIHVGESTRVPGAEGKPDKLLGLAIDTACRVMELALPGQILLTRPAFDSARQYVLPVETARTVGWRAHGPYRFRGLDEPLEVFEAGVAGVAPLEAPADTEKARRAIVPGDEETLGWRPAISLEIPGRPGWSLERRLGRGGFGEIWLARNERTDEVRAFKFCFEAARLRSLKRELTLFRLLKQTLGERPDITRLYEVQFEEAPYFLEMEYTSGGSLDAWFARQDSVPRGTRLELVAQVADALAAAHSVGVIHKDVKPSNVLIDDARPQARLTDFGIGQLLDPGVLGEAGVTADGFEGEPTFATDLGSRTGTRLYMAPELFAGKPATIASDIYAAGVLLYQMIVGDLAKPLAQGWEADVDDGLLRDDIAACVAGDPDARLRSADLLAERLRSLGERRIARDREREQAKRDARRRRVFRASVAASAVLLLVAATAIAGYLRADRERRRAEEAEARARERFGEVRELANAVLFEFDEKLRDLPGSLPARRLLVERALGYLDRLPSDDPDLARERARGYVRVARIQGLPGWPNLGDRDGALANLDKAHAIVAPLHERDPGDRSLALLYASILRQRGALTTTSDPDERRNPDLDRAEQILEELSRRFPDDAVVWNEYGVTLSSQAAWHHTADDDPTRCREYFERSIALRQSLREQGRLTPGGLRDLAVTRANYGAELMAIWKPERDVEAALDQFEEERALLDELAGREPGSFDTELAIARNRMGIGQACYFLRRHDRALESYADAERRLRRLIQLHPSDLRTRRLVATSGRRRAQVYSARKELDEAIQAYEGAAAALTDLPPGVTLNSEAVRERAILHEQAGSMLLRLERRDEARAAFDRALADFKAEYDPASTDGNRRLFYPLACRRHAQDLFEHGEDERALELLLMMDDAFREIEAHRPGDAELAAFTTAGRETLAHFWREQGLDERRPTAERRDALREAIAAYERVIATYEQHGELGSRPREHPDSGEQTTNHGRAEAWKQHCEAALRAIE